jgi:hypothetical protein
MPGERCSVQIAPAQHHPERQVWRFARAVLDTVVRLSGADRQLRWIAPDVLASASTIETI